ncbi:hypothetical protein A5712_02455 [Mycobacterium sp. E2327]|nr:hypothetical protein A5712_02455 [Mycobacterium sp. E2327]
MTYICRVIRVLVYSSDSEVRARVRRALGQLPESGSPPVDFVEVATQPAVTRETAEGKVDLVILDGEASPSGGIGVARQLKDELHQCPPIVLIIGRPDDAWLAVWSGADAVVPRGLDPIALKEAAVPLLPGRLAV